MVAMAVSMAETVLYVPAMGSMLPLESKSRMVPEPCCGPSRSSKPSHIEGSNIGSHHELVIISDCPCDHKIVLKVSDLQLKHLLGIVALY